MIYYRCDKEKDEGSYERNVQYQFSEWRDLQQKVNTD
jgi:stalled ribosome alternative rescue factor ArfA